MTTLKSLVIAVCVSCVAFVCLTIPLSSHSHAQDDAAAEDAKAVKLAERFQQLLQRQPRFGTSLDRVYGHHVERGTLDDFTKSLNDKVKADPTDGTTWMVLGLFEMQRGRDSEATKALSAAEQHRETDPMASYYLGKSLVLVGETEKAAAAYERAITRKPRKIDLLAIYQELGRIHQRTHDTDKALAVWDRLETQFPDDTRVQEQIATILADENDFAGALKRFESLATKSKDRYRKVQYALQAGDMQIRLGKTTEAIAKFETQLATLKPDSWLHRDVRRRIEDVYLKSDDYAGLVDYYEAWLKKNPDDIDAMTRVGNSLSFQGRAADARGWYEKAVKLAPTNKTLRKALIDQLVREKKFADAIKQYSELDRIDPNNPDNIEQWGLLVMEDESRPEAARKALASKVWKRLTDNKPNDAIIASQVADLHRSAKLSEEAITLYKKAIELAPGDVQYREYLGEYYHQLDKKDEAIQIWRSIAAGDKRNTVNLVRLAEVFDSFGYPKLGVETMADACSLKPEFADRVRYAQMLSAVKRFDDGLQQLAIADSIVESPEEVGLVLNERIKNYQSSGQLAERTTTLQTELDSGKDATLDRWKQLALYYEAATRLNEATAAVEKALALDKKSVPVWTVAARVYEKSGRLGEATSANRTLADLDRRYRTEYLKTIAGLEMRLGRVDESLQAGRDLIAAAPGNPEHYQFFANLCFQLGKPEMGLDALRRSVRVNPSDQSSLNALASALAEQFKTAESIELYWRSFEKSEDLDGQISVVNRLADLYLRTNHFDRLISRLENRGKELNQQRDMTLCLSTAYQAAGDLGMARSTLESLLSEDSRDVDLLKQLSNAAEREDDLENAIKYQRRIADLLSDPNETSRLASLLAKNGNVDEAEKIWMRTVETDREVHRIYEAIDKLIGAEKYSAASTLLDKRLRQNPKSWEAVYRQGFVAWKQDKKDDAYKHFVTLTNLDIDRDNKTSKAEYLAEQARKRSKSKTSSPVSVNYYDYMPKQMIRGQANYQVKQAFQLDSRYGNNGQSNQVYVPNDFGTARVAGLMLQLNQANDAEKTDEFLATIAQKARDSIEVTTEPTWDWLFLMQSQDINGTEFAQSDEYKEIIGLFRKRNDPVAHWFTLSKLMMRQHLGQQNSTELEPLPKEELDEALVAAKSVMETNPAWLMYGNSAAALSAELSRSDREEEATVLYETAMKSANDDRSLALATQFAASRGDIENVVKLHERSRNKTSRANNPFQNSAMGNSTFLGLVIKKMKDDDQNWDVALQLLERQLTDQREDFEKQKGRRRRSSSQNSSNYVYVFKEGGSYDYKQLDYPQPDQYFDQSAIAYLYNTWQLAERYKVQDKTLDWLTQRTESTTGNDQLLSHLALSHVLWWKNDKSASIQQLAKAVQKAPDNVDMLMRLAETRQQDGDPEQALALIDSIQATDHNVLREREILALQLAVTTGNIERARKAAGRLFGLRLDANTQIQLAAQMHQLGMHDMAEGVLARSRRQAGNSSTTLVSLMQQYSSQGKAEIASQIANQILRRIPLTSLRPGINNSDSTARRSAIQTLKRSGGLDKLITRVQEQLKRSPKSLQLHKLLAEYYKASGDTDKAMEVLAKISKVAPNDAKSLLALAQQLERSGKHKEATDSYLAAFAKDASLFSNNYYQIIRTFESAKRLPELARSFKDADLKKVRQSYYFTQLVSNLMRDKKLRPDGLEFLKRLWKVFPNERPNLISSISSSAWREMPELIEYAREGLIPTNSQTAANGWNNLRINSYSSDGTGTGALTYIMQGLEKDNDTLAALIKDVTAASKKYENWHAGPALLCVLEVRAGKIEEGQKRLETLMVAAENIPIPMNSAWMIGQELEGKNEDLDRQVIRLYEQALSNLNTNNGDELKYSPLRRLSQLYAKYDRKADARKLVYRMIDDADYSRNSASNPGYGESQTIDGIIAASTQMIKLEFPVDSVQLLDRITDDMTTKAIVWNGSYTKTKIERANKAANKAVTPAAVLAALDDWLDAGEAWKETSTDNSASSQKSTPTDKPTNKDKPEPATQNSADGVIDLMLAVRPQTLDQATVKSMFVNSLELAMQESAKKPIVQNKNAPNDGPRSEQPEVATLNLDLVDQRLAALFEKHPNDVGVAVGATVLAFMRKDIPTAESRLQKLASLKSSTGSAASKSDLALWLVARHAITHEKTKDAGQQLAQRAINAAEKQSGSLWEMAILRERGEIALAAGDRDAAEAQWSQMLDEILTPETAVQSGKTPRNTDVKSAVESVLKALRGK